MDSLNHALPLIIGGIIGLLLAALIVIICSKGESRKPEYDERQYIARLKSYKAGFLTMLISSVIMAVLALAGIEIPTITAVKYFIPFVMGILAMVSVGIWTDGYWGMNTNKRLFIIIMSIITVFNLVVPLIEWKVACFTNTDGLIGVPMIEFLVGVMVAILLMQLLLKDYIDRKIDEKMSKEDDE